MSKRDEFTQKTKDAVAARAGWHCSMCGKHTVGPSEESSEAIAKIGKAAHITAAAPGGRRYDPAMTPAQRSGIGNAIWMCSDHAELIDRDEVTYTVGCLQTMKRDHEQAISRAVRTGAVAEIATGLLGVGPDVIIAGDLTGVSADLWTLRLSHFLTGDMHKLVSYIDAFGSSPSESRYILSNELGDGRTLSDAPRFAKETDGRYTLYCPIEPAFPRTNVHKLGGDLALHCETNDLFLDADGDLARVSGLAYLPQKVQTLLSLQRNESVFAPDYGVRLFEFHQLFKGSPWLDLLMKIEVVRQAAIPFRDPAGGKHTPLQCVTRVHDVELLADEPVEHRLPLRVAFDVNGFGRWERQVSIYMPTAEQMAARARLIAETPWLVPTIDQGHVESISTS